MSVCVGRAGIRFVPNGMIMGSAFAGGGLIDNVGSCGDVVVIEPVLVLIMVEWEEGAAVCKERSPAAIAAAAAIASSGF